MSVKVDQVLRQAKAEVKAGRPGQARSMLLEALERYPDNPRLLDSLAEAQGAFTGLVPRPFAAPHFQRVMRIKSALGLQAAAEEMVAAARLNPTNPMVRNILGGVLLEAKDPAGAIPHLQTALRLDPAFREAAVNLANALRQLGHLKKATLVLQGALQKHPDFLPGLQLLGEVLETQNRIAEAVACWERIMALTPDDVAGLLRLAVALSAAQRLPDARALLEQGQARWPDDHRICINLGNLLLSQGDLTGAQQQFERAIVLKPNTGSAYYNLGRAMDFTADGPHLPALQQLVQDTTLPIDDRVAAHFALAKALEDCGDAAGSFQHLEQGNALRRSQTDYALAQDRLHFQALRQRFARGAGPALVPAEEALRRRPVFIVGMMRSGTTLMEQILSSHPMVHGGGELEDLPALMAGEDEGVERPGALDLAALGRIRQGYLAAINALPGNEPVVVDKLPANFRFVGLIRKALPEARILHMRRDPVAVCWSIYKTLFTNLAIGYASRLEDIMGYYDLYEEMMAFWRHDDPAAFLDVDYEALTRDPEPAIRRALDYCDLPFDPACLRPQENQRSVRTASLRQVRSGIYTGSSSKWRGFEPFLAPLIAHFADRAR